MKEAGCGEKVPVKYWFEITLTCATELWVDGNDGEGERVNCGSG